MSAWLLLPSCGARVLVVMARIATAAALALFATASRADDLSQLGDACTLEAPLRVRIAQAAGTLEVTLEPGARVEIVAVNSGDSGFARVLSGDVRGDVSTAEFTSACRGALRTCQLVAPVTMYEENRSDSKAWRIKSGANLSVLKQGRTWGAVRVGDLSGFVKTEELEPACTRAASDANLNGDESEAAGADPVERGDGPGVLFLPFAIEGAVPVGTADALLQLLSDRGAYYRPDAALLADPRDVRRARRDSWQEQIAGAAKRASIADTEFAIIGRLALEPNADRSLRSRLLLQLAAIEASTGAVVKAIRIRPTTKPEDTWPEKALAALLPLLPIAPGSKIPAAAQTSETLITVLDAPRTREAPRETSSWLANPWGWLTLAAGAALASGSGVVCVAALEDNTRANGTPAADPAQIALRNSALAQAITADALGIAAAGALITSAVVFATRAGHPE